MDDVVQQLRKRGGVASWSELKSSVARDQLAAALSTGQVSRVRRNLYVLASLHDVRRVAIEAGGVASHLTAAQHWGWKVKDPPERPCITLARGSRVPTGDLELHWADLDPGGVTGHVTRRVPTVVACARAYDQVTALCVADSALREGQVTRAQLLAAARSSPRTGRSRAISVVQLADGRAANPFESVLRWLCCSVAGLSAVPQVELRGIGRVDLMDARLGIVIEAESFEFHGSLVAFRRDVRRDVRRYTECARRGLAVVRFTWHEVMHQQEFVRAALTDVVRARSAAL
jgi:very-short-patch-repair endonuclease